MVRAGVIGHRGARGETPENTLAGFRHAAGLKIAIEADVAMTRDLVPVMHHDAALPDGRLICDVACGALPSYVPRLADCLAALPGQRWFLEIKTFPAAPAASHAAAVMAAGVVRVVRESGVDLENIAIKAFDWEVLREVAGRCPALPRFALTAPETEAARACWWGGGYGGFSTPRAAATVATGWSAFHETLTAAAIGEARVLGLRVLAWTVNEAADFARFSPLVDGIVTDFPSRFLARGGVVRLPARQSGRD